MKILTRDDTEHDVEYVTRADAEREIEAWKEKAKDIAKDYLREGMEKDQVISKLREAIRAYRDAKGRYHTQKACERLLSLLPKKADCPSATGSPSYLTRETGWHAEYLKASDRALQMEIERNDARRDRDEWKASAEQYHRANASLDKAWSEMLALLRRHLLQENEKTPIWKIEQNTAQRNTPKNS